jgi:hypothetical protein
MVGRDRGISRAQGSFDGPIIFGMASIQVDVAGMDALAVHCQSLAAEVGGVSASSSSMPSGQATAAAVQAVHADVATAGTAMVARQESTSAKLAAAALSFGTREIGSTDAVAAVAPTSAV